MTGKNELESTADADIGETEEREPSKPPHQNPTNIRVMGKWRPKGYKPTKAERDAWLEKCEALDLDPKTGKPKNKPGKK